MGVDKALLEVDGVAMAERVARALEAGGCAPVLFVGGDEAGLTTLGRPWLADRWPGEGPLGGILTALAASDADVVAAACDLPRLDARSVRAVLSAAAERPRVDVVVAVSERLEPMFAWWSAAARPALEAAWSAGVRAVRDAIATVEHRQVAVDAAALHNANRPADLGSAAPRRAERDRGATEARS